MKATIIAAVSDGTSNANYWKQVEREADILVTCVFLGLVEKSKSAVCIEREPLYDESERTKWEKSGRLHEAVVDKLVDVLGWRGKLLNAVTEEMHGRSSLIVSRTSNNIHKAATLLSRIEREVLARGFEDGVRGTWYEGRGAYHGVVLDLRTGKRKVVSQSDTRRVSVNSRARWKPAKALRASAPKSNSLGVWGLISADAGASPPEGMGSFPTTITSSSTTKPAIKVDDDLVGYEHGMCRCMNIAGDDMYKANTAVIELALGDATLKAASCFPCTTYMISNGVWPTGIHVGSGESWVPPSNANNSATSLGDTTMPPTDYGNADIQVAKWAKTVEAWGREGLAILLEREVLPHVVEVYDPVLEIVNSQVSDAGSKGTYFSVKFLDALTFHKKELDRLASVFGVTVS